MADIASLRLVVFDCDGTLIDSFAAIIAALQSGWQAVDREPPLEHLLRSTVGIPLEGAIVRLDPGVSEAQLKTIAERYRKSLAVRDNILQPGVKEALMKLRAAGYFVGIATGMGRWRLDQILQQHGLVDQFDTLQTSDTNPGKPSPQMLQTAMADTGTLAIDTVMIGDSVQDMAMAKNAGVAAIGISWGAEPGPTLKMAGAKTIIENFADLPSIVGRLLSYDN